MAIEEKGTNQLENKGFSHISESQRNISTVKRSFRRNLGEVLMKLKLSRVLQELFSDFHQESNFILFVGHIKSFYKIRHIT